MRSLTRTGVMVALAVTSTLGLSACGSTTGGGGGAAAASSTPAASVTASTGPAAAMVAQHRQAFCGNATALGSLTKGNADAMAMSPAESAKDFKALAARVMTLKADAPATIRPAIDTVVARLGVEEMEMTHKAAGTDVSTEMTQLQQQKATDDAAVTALIAEVRTSCGVDIT